MEKDPVELTRDEENLIVAEIRKGRKTWAQEDAKAKTSGKRAKTSKGLTAKKQIEATNNAEEMGIDIDTLLDEIS
ncbi:MAG: hypothetical protein ACR2NL_05640 [Acidimicrobiia bacterium]